MGKIKLNYASEQEEYILKYENVWNIWYHRLKDIMISSIEWEGNPFYPQFNVPEKFLFEIGRCVAFVDDTLGFMILPATGSSSLNPIGEPSEYMAYTMNGATYQGLKPGEDCVVILNDVNGFPGQNICSNYAERLTEIQITWLCNLNANKTPITIAADEDDLLTVQNYCKGFTLGKSLIITKNGRLTNFTPTAISTGAPFIAPQLTLELRSVWSEFLTYVGVPSMDINKSERLLRDEVSQAMGGAIASRVPRLGTRKKAAEEIKKLFGIEINPIMAIDDIDMPKYIRPENMENDEGDIF